MKAIDIYNSEIKRMFEAGEVTGPDADLLTIWHNFVLTGQPGQPEEIKAIRTVVQAKSIITSILAFVENIRNEPDEQPAEEVKPAPSVVFDADYTGPRWRYASTLRPCTSFNIPDGWIMFSQRPHSAYSHGTVDYTKPLTDFLVKQYDMVLIEAL